MKARVTVHIILGIALAVAASGGWAYAAGSDTDVMAAVNGEQITRGALIDRFLSLTNTGRVMLGEMIGETLLLQEAKKRNVSVTDQEVQDRINMIKQRLPEQDRDKAFAQYLADQNVTLPGLTYKVKIKLLAEKILQDRVAVTDAEVQQAYDLNKNRFDQPEKVALRWIRVKTEADAKAAEDRLAKGELFENVAKDVSTELASRQGVVTEVVKQELDDELQEPAFSTAVGKYTDPIKAKDGDYVIIEVVRKTAAIKHDPAFVKEQMRMDLRERKLRQAYYDLMQTLTKEGKIENKLEPTEP